MLAPGTNPNQPDTINTPTQGAGGLMTQLMSMGMGGAPYMPASPMYGAPKLPPQAGPPTEPRMGMPAPPQINMGEIGSGYTGGMGQVPKVMPSDGGVGAISASFQSAQPQAAPEDPNTLRRLLLRNQMGMPGQFLGTAGQ